MWKTLNVQSICEIGTFEKQSGYPKLLQAHEPVFW